MNGLARSLFRALPATPRSVVLWARLRLRDALHHRGQRFARTAAYHALPAQRSWRQPIHPTSTAENKRHNLRLAADALAATTLQPGDVFSFARIVGPPVSLRGFRDGRTLVGGSLAASAGGGLCQLSGLLYLAALECGLDVVERHPHSLDIYTDATRFAPLGADATVVYGHLDLRLRNPYAQAVGFRCRVEEDRIELDVCCDLPLPQRQVTFAAHAIDAGHVRVVTRIDDAAVCEQVYPRAATVA